MKKLFGKITAILLTVCLAVTMLVLVGCDSTGKTTGTTYSVTVLLDANTPAQNVKVSWGSFGGIATDKDGKASTNLESGDYEISLSSLPEGYSYNEKVTATANNPDVKITLTNNNGGDPSVITYTVKVLKPDGTPLANAKVGLCSESCSSPRETDANGVVSFKSNALPESANGHYHVQIWANSITGYTYNKDEGNYYIDADGKYIEVTPEAPDLVITLIAA